MVKADALPGGPFGSAQGRLAGHDVDGGGQRGGIAGPQAGLHPGVEGPGGADHQPAIQQGVDHRLPAGGGFVGVDDGGDAPRFEDALHLAEGEGQLLLEEAFARLKAPFAFGVGHDFARLGSERGGKEVRVEVAHRALEPDVEEVRQVGIGHVVVVGRVGQDGVEVVIGPG